MNNFLIDVFEFLFEGFIICDDTELCDKIISRDVETEQRRRNLAKSLVIKKILFLIKDVFFYFIIEIGNQLISKKLIY